MERENRRDFLVQTGVAGIGYWVAGGLSAAESNSPNEKLNIASIGCGGKGGSDIGACASQNVVALCDVDHERAAGAIKQFPNATRYKDFRKMLEKEKIDAVVVSTPDHTHAVAAAMAMKMGKHVYCQKPLTHTVFEARRLRELAAEHKVATQMGNQGTAHSGLRRAVEIIQAGVIGGVSEVHVWTNRPIWPQGQDAIYKTFHAKTTGMSKDDWDLWLGPAAERPYLSNIYHPFAWRGWWDFGTGALGDMACHTANMAFMSLKLGSPTSVVAESGEINPQTYPTWARITFEFPARGDLPPVKFVWYEGKKDGKKVLPAPELAKGNKLSDSGSLLVGDKGVLFSPNDYGAQYRLLPEENFKDYKGPEPTIARHKDENNDLNQKLEWFAACKGGPAALSNFNYAAMLTETILLGNVAMRAGEKLMWDGPNLKFTNNSDANKYLHTEYRKGWTL